MPMNKEKKQSFIGAKKEGNKYYIWLEKQKFQITQIKPAIT